MRFSPSNSNGLVTTATVSTLSSFATCANIGAAPVPVRPPIPAVINTISAPLISSLILSLSSRAASLPFSGKEPAPKPWVIFSPSISFVEPCILSKACLSVFAQMKCAPSIPPCNI